MKLNKFVSDFFEKNCYYSIFILLSNFFTRFQFRLKSCKLVFEIFKEKTTKQMNKIKLNMYFYFANFHIKLKLIITKYKIFLKYFILIKCIILLYFFLIFLILSSDQLDWSMFLYIFIIFIILNNYQETVFFSFLI